MYNVDIKNNFTSFYCHNIMQTIFVETFDSIEFEIRIGSIESSQNLGSVFATSSKELNEKITVLIRKTIINKV